MTINVAIFSNFDVSSDITLAGVFEAHGVNITSVSYMSSMSTTAKGSLISSAFQLSKKMSRKYWFFLVVLNLTYWAGQILMPKWLQRFRPNHMLGLYKLARRVRVPIRTIADVNHPNVVDTLKNEKVDILVIRISQILKAESISAPALGTLCIHSSLLPSYKGIAGEFHARLDGASFIGSSLFEVTEKLDAGDIVSQSAFEVDNTWPIRRLILKNNRLGRGILREHLTEVASGQSGSVREGLMDTPSSQRTWPSRADLRRAKRLGIKLW